MILNEWEVWLNYASHLMGKQPDLPGVASRLVASGLAECAVLRDGRYYWSKEAKEGACEVLIDAANQKVTFEFRPNIPSGFAQEVLLQACYFRFAELRLFGEGAYLPPNYVRAYMGGCELLSDGLSITAYPVITLYETGVVFVEFRLISGEHPLSHEEFIKKFVNLFQARFDSVLVPPSLVSLSLRANWLFENSTWPRDLGFMLRLANSSTDRSVKERTISVTRGDFTFQLAPIWEIEAVEEGVARHRASSNPIDSSPYVNNSTKLAQAIVDAVRVLLVQREGPLSDLRRAAPPPKLGAFWTSRPHIHLLKFDDQQETAAENELKHKSALGWIVARVPGGDPQVGASFLPKNQRAFGDYATYPASNMTLWVWALKGLEAQKPWGDANRGHLVYEHQATAELLDYGYHRLCSEQLSRLAQGSLKQQGIPKPKIERSLCGFLVTNDEMMNTRGYLELSGR